MDYSKLLFLSDTHNRFKLVDDVIKYNPNKFIIQLGDMELGKTHVKQPASFPPDFFFIRGNHDKRLVCCDYPNYLGEYGFNEELDLFFVSGAWSIDRQTRSRKNFFVDEELSADECRACFELYKKVRPKLVVTHEGPGLVVEHLLKSQGHTFGVFPNKTSLLLDDMFREHQPENWVFGHHHTDFTARAGGTLFKCVDLYSTYSISGNIVV